MNSARVADLEAELNALATERTSVQEECDSAKEKLREAEVSASTFAFSCVNFSQQEFERSYEKHVS